MNWSLDNHDSLVIAGPTACGKTRLAVQAARALGAEIISADSRQVYKGLDIGSGKDLVEYGCGALAIPYYCIDCADPSQIYTLWHYQQDAYRALNKVISQGKVPLICGGTGLYIEAVLRQYELSNVPEDPALRNELMQIDKEKLLAELHTLAPELARRTDTSSKKRIVRALEIARAPQLPSSPLVLPPKLKPRVVVLTCPRPVLHERIRARLEQRFEQGMVDEVAGLLKSGISLARMELLGMEYGHISRYLSGEYTYTHMVDSLYQAICHLAKRQTTWFAGMPRRGISAEFLAI